MPSAARCRIRRSRSRMRRCFPASSNRAQKSEGPPLWRPLSFGGRGDQAAARRARARAASRADSCALSSLGALPESTSWPGAVINQCQSPCGCSRTVSSKCLPSMVIDWIIRVSSTHQVNFTLSFAARGVAQPTVMRGLAEQRTRVAARRFRFPDPQKKAAPPTGGAASRIACDVVALGLLRDLDHAVARLADALCRRDRRLTLTDPAGVDVAFRHAGLDQELADGIGAALRQCEVVGIAAGAVGLADQDDMQFGILLRLLGDAIQDLLRVGAELRLVEVEIDAELTRRAGRRGSGGRWLGHRRATVLELSHRCLELLA